MSWQSILVMAGLSLGAISLLACIAMFRYLMRLRAAEEGAASKHREELKAVTMQRDRATEDLLRCRPTVVDILGFIADEVERATGHTDEAAALERLARDVRMSKRVFDVVDQETISRIEKLGIAVPKDGIHLLQTLEIAVAIDAASRVPERHVFEVVRTCQLHDSPHREGKWIADTLSLMQRLCGGDAVRAREKLRAVLQAWERADPSEVGYLVESEQLERGSR
ncbi:hypothetical protein ABIC83_002825 [Roseateles asaccharophilus]|uniref:hypothetical protein n=1 Tax=Roseateles asaccharophilus TaxID=582607 RepID=UPI003839BB47